MVFRIGDEAILTCHFHLVWHICTQIVMSMNGAKQISINTSGVLNMFLKGYPLEAKDAPKN